MLVKIIGYRLFNQCTGKVLASKPASAKLGPVVKAAGCGSAPVVVRRVGPRVKSLPERLNSLMIKDAMARISPLVQRCYTQFNVPGLAKAYITVQSDGTVLRVKLRGKFKGSPTTGACLKKAIKRARFKRFRVKRMTFYYPWFLR